MEPPGLLKFLSWMLIMLQGLETCSSLTFWNPMDIRYWRCVMRKSGQCPDKDVNFFLYTPENQWKRRVNPIGVDSLRSLGWFLDRENVIIVHGFNSSEALRPISFLVTAYRSRGYYNVFTVDWSRIGLFPCYLSALNNLRLVSQCTAQLYSRITNEGALARSITCVGHSMGAHVCGMISNHLSEPQHKIIGLDAARPVVDTYGSREFRLTRDDAHTVFSLMTNAGFIGETGLVGHASFCINGGAFQPGCQGPFLHRVGCSHGQGVCYFAALVWGDISLVAQPCSQECPKTSPDWGLTLTRPAVRLGEKFPIRARGMYCLQIDSEVECPVG